MECYCRWTGVLLPSGNHRLQLHRRFEPLGNDLRIHPRQLGPGSYEGFLVVLLLLLLLAAKLLAAALRW